MDTKSNYNNYKCINIKICFNKLYHKIQIYRKSWFENKISGDSFIFPLISNDQDNVKSLIF